MAILSLEKALCINNRPLNLEVPPEPTPGKYRILYENDGVAGFFNYKWVIDCDAITPDLDIVYRTQYNSPWIPFTLAQKQALLSSSGLMGEFQAILIEHANDNLTRFSITKSNGQPEYDVRIFPTLTIVDTSIPEMWAYGQSTEEYYVWCTVTATHGNVTFDGY